MVKRLIAADEFARYELAEDLTEHHHHLICSACGEMSDFTIGDGIEAELERALAGVARRHDYRVEHHRLDLVGLCPRCA